MWQALLDDKNGRRRAGCQLTLVQERVGKREDPQFPRASELRKAVGRRLLIGHRRLGYRLKANTAEVVVALSGDEIVGFARGIADGISNGYLSMVVVDELHRRRGIGQALVDCLIGSEPNITWVLLAGREGAAEFFDKLGFTPSTIAVERPRR